jgi:hypothetical protein
MHLVLPLSFTELTFRRAFLSADGRIVRAAMAMLHAAWACEQPGRISPAVEALAQITALEPILVQEHYAVLTDGWELREGWLCEPSLEAAAVRMQDRFGDQLSQMRASWLAAVQPMGQSDGEDFELVPNDIKRPSTRRGKCLLPKHFAPDQTTLRHLASAGYGLPERQEWLLQRFKDYADGEGRMQKDWQAFLRNFAGSDITTRQFTAHFGCAPTAPTHVLSSATAAERLRQRMPPTFAEVTQARNSGAMASALAARFDQYEMQRQ